ncbi:polysaccharide deacetylase (plasmid) [Bacillus mycoides]|nr:polysaccharide deacetylase [Bacillus mycoides]
MGIIVAYKLLMNNTESKKAMMVKNSVSSVQKVSEIPKSNVIKQPPVQYNNQKRRVVYLTFDDGPGKYTDHLLDILKENNVKATFFLVGSSIKQYPDQVKREVNEGNYVGMHSLTHDANKLYKQGTFISEMKEDQQLIANIIGYSPKLTRPPFGSKPYLSAQQKDELVQNHLKIWDWNLDSEDWKYNKMELKDSVPKIVQNVLSHATGSREVVLIHDIHPQSVEAVPLIIKGLKEKGYEFEVYNESSHFTLNFWNDNRL